MVDSATIDSTRYLLQEARISLGDLLEMRPRAGRRGNSFLEKLRGLVGYIQGGFSTTSASTMVERLGSMYADVDWAEELTRLESDMFGIESRFGSA
jgi:hypothetical protein